VHLSLEYEPEGLVEKVGDKLNVIENRAEGDLDRFKAFIEAEDYATGAWRGSVNQGLTAGAPETIGAAETIGAPDVDDAAASRGDSGNAGVSGKAVAAGLGLAAAATAAGIAAASSNSSETTTPATPDVTPPVETAPTPASPGTSPAHSGEFTPGRVLSTEEVNEITEDNEDRPGGGAGS
jgi:hypothetical protein